MAKLDNLRSSPVPTADLQNFLLDARGGPASFVDSAGNDVVSGNIQRGGPVKLVDGAIQNRVGRIKIGAHDGGPRPDYFYPWKPRGVGYVDVPAAAPDGTIVATPAMNGCSAEVRDMGDGNIRFYHDHDGNTLDALLPDRGGSLLTRVNYRHYAPTQHGARMTDGLTDGTSFGHQVLFVKNGDQWQGVNSGVIMGPGLETPAKEGYRDGLSSSLTSF